MPSSKRGRVPLPGRRLGLGNAELRGRLNSLARRYDGSYVQTDPVGIVRRFERPEDRELVGLLAAGLAYGRAEGIRRSLDRLLAVIGSSPSRFLEAYEPRVDARRFDRFVHRFTRGRDVALLLWLVRQARERSGSLEAFFLQGDDEPASDTFETPMNRFGERLFSLDARPFHPSGRVPREDGVRWLLPLPANGSVCKRHCLFLRWMVRPDDGVDCGTWGGATPSRLVVPLDVHLERVSRALGWTRRRTSGWAMALEVTSTLRLIDPADPARYDFALSRLGILGLLGARNGRPAVSKLVEVFDRALLEDGGA